MSNKVDLDLKDFITSILIVFIATNVIWILSSFSGRDYKQEYKDLRIRYNMSICLRKGLTYNDRNSEPWCMDPKTKAIYEIEE